MFTRMLGLGRWPFVTFDGEGGDGTGGAGSAGGSGGAGGAGEGGAGGGTARTFTQEEVNRFVQDRLNQDRRDRLSDDEIQQLRDRAARADELEAADQSEVQRLQTELDKVKGERDAALADADTAKGQVKETQRRSKIVAAAAKAGAKDPDAVYALLKEDGFKVSKGDTTFEVTIGDDGQVTGLDDAIPAFLESKDYLVGEPPKPGPADGGVRTSTSGALTKEQLAQMTPQEVAAQKPEDVRAALAED